MLKLHSTKFRISKQRCTFSAVGQMWNLLTCTYAIVKCFGGVCVCVCVYVCVCVCVCDITAVLLLSLK